MRKWRLSKLTKRERERVRKLKSRFAHTQTKKTREEEEAGKARSDLGTVVFMKLYTVN